jgi:hypothetical protein
VKGKAGDRSPARSFNAAQFNVARMFLTAGVQFLSGGCRARHHVAERRRVACPFLRLRLELGRQDDSDLQSVS